MELKSKIEASNCLIMNEQSNIEFLGEEFYDEDFLYNACFYSIFATYWNSYVHVPK